MAEYLKEDGDRNPLPDFQGTGSQESLGKLVKTGFQAHPRAPGPGIGLNTV